MATWSFKVKDIIDGNVLPLIFEKIWYQEDILELKDTIFSHIKNTSTIEHAKGADRESIRFDWQDIPLSLHFECYSQSCWLETESVNDNSSLIPLHTILS